MATLRESEPITLPLPESLPYDLVLCRWDDADVSTGWELESTLSADEDLATTTGFLVKKTKSHYIIAGSYYFNKVTEEYQFNSRTQIPKGMVKKLTVLVKKHVDKSKIKVKEPT